MAFILQFHGEMRWIVALAALITVVKYAAGWLGKMEYQRIDRILLSATTGLFDLNLLLGLILLVGLGGGLPQPRLEHAITMFVAVLVMHSTAGWRKSGSSVTKFRNGFLTVLVALLLGFVAVMRLRGGWTF
jgi:hypothetical protein